jgi:ribosomal protein S18 acetylase RimI-like enzyme
MSLFPTGREPLNASPADVGRRLRVVHSGDGPKKEETTVGVLFRWTGGAADGILRLRERTGVEAGIRASDILEARVIAPEVSAFDMERLAQQGWPPLESEQVGDWDLRYSAGYSDRANSVRVAAPPTSRSLKSMLSLVEDWYKQRGAEPRLQIPEPSGMTGELEKLGWNRQRTSRMMINSVSRLLSATASARERTDLDIEVRDQPNGEWYELVSGYRASTYAEFHHIVAAVEPAAYVFCRNQQGELLGIARATLQGTWCGATTMATTPQSRRRGIARAVTGQMALWAQEQGATDWYLQVFHDNAAARSFYEKVGFTTHHIYTYRRKNPNHQ